MINYNFSCTKYWEEFIPVCLQILWQKRQPASGGTELVTGMYTTLIRTLIPGNTTYLEVYCQTVEKKPTIASFHIFSQRWQILSWDLSGE